MVRKLNDFEDCIKKGLLRKTAPSTAEASKSVERAKRWASQAREALEADL
jgi:hypothetical protein